MSVLLRKKYESIKKEKLSDSGKALLKSMAAATNNFKDAKASAKIKTKFLAFFDKLKTSKPEAIKGLTAPKEPSNAKQFKEARERRSGQSGVPQRESDIEKDAGRPAISVKGKRVTDGKHYPYIKGNVYYEYRDNRFDKRPKKYPKLEDGGMMAKGGETKDLEKVIEKVDNFLNPLGYSAKVEKSIGDVLYIVEPSTRKVGKNRSDFFDGMQILAFQDGTFEVSEYQAGENEDELYIYKETKSLTLALKDLVKGNKRKPIKKYADGGEMADGGTMAKGGSVKEEIEIKGHTIKHIKNSYDDYWYFIYQSTPFEFETKEEAVKSLNGLIKTNPYADGGMMAMGGEPHRIDEIFADGGSIAQGNNEMLESQLKAVEHHAKELSSIVNKDTEVEAWVVGKIERAATDLSDITHYLDGRKFEGGGSVDSSKFYVAVSETKDGYWVVMSRPTHEKWVAESMIENVPRNEVGKVVTLDEARKHTKIIGKEYLTDDMIAHPNKFADGGEMMAKGGEIEVGDMVELKSGQKAKVVRVEESWIGVQTSNNMLKDVYKEDVKKLADGGMMAKGGESQGYDDREDERLSMEHGKISGKDFVGSHKQREHSRRDDARFEERMAKGGFVSKGELVWSKLNNSKKSQFLKENFTPQITPRSQEILVGKDFQFLPKDVKIKLESKYADVEEYRYGGMMAKGGKLIGKQKNIDVNKNGKLDAEDFKLLRQKAKSRLKK